MTDLRAMLHASAPTPRAPLDMAEIQRRAHRRGSRRFAYWLGLAGLILSLGIPGRSVLVTAGDQHGEHAGPKTKTMTTTTTTQLAPEDLRAATAARLGRASAAKPVGGGAPRGGGSTDNQPPATTRPPSTDAYPRAASCSVNNAGLGPNEQRRCRFTATAVGGASLRGSCGDEVNCPSGQVLVTRNGATTARPVTGASLIFGDYSQGCLEQFIQPGDLVEVILTNSANGTGVGTIGAGQDWEC